MMPRRIWAIADTHLSFAHPKPMDVFGAQWKDHPQKIKANCEKLVEQDDLLLIPGDLSWALKRSEADMDLAFLAALPGIKVLCKGNHDYWWDSDKPLNYPGLHDTPFMTDDAQIGVAGIRGWTPITFDKSPDERASDAKIIAREVRRLEKRLIAIEACPVKYAMIHYPPLPEFIPILRQYGVDTVLYGHLHLGGDETLPEFWNGLRCLCVAADRIRFVPRLIDTIGSPLPVTVPIGPHP